MLIRLIIRIELMVAAIGIAFVVGWNWAAYNNQRARLKLADSQAAGHFFSGRGHRRLPARAR